MGVQPVLAEWSHLPVPSVLSHFPGQTLPTLALKGEDKWEMIKSNEKNWKRSDLWRGIGLEQWFPNLTHKYHLRRPLKMQIPKLRSQAQQGSAFLMGIYGHSDAGVFWETPSWESWGEIGGPRPLTFASLPPEVHSQPHNCSDERSAGQCQPDCSFSTQGPRPWTPFALWDPEASCGGDGGGGTLSGCLGGGGDLNCVGGWEDMRNMQILH